MSRTITALFDSRADAEAGAERLRRAGVDASHINVHDHTTHNTEDGAYSTAKNKGLWASIKSVFVPHEDRHLYEEGLRRGGFLLTADVDDDATPEAVRALDEANSVDLDARSQEWRAAGWDYVSDPAYDEVDEVLPYGSRDPGARSPRYRSYVPGERE